MSVWGLNLDALSLNLGLDMSAILVLVLFCGCIIFMARSFNLGAILLFLGNGLLFALCHHLGANYTYPLVMMFISLILMAISIYATGKQAEGFT